MKNLTIVSAALFALATLVARGEEPAPARSTAQVTLRVEIKNIRAEKEKKQADDKKEKDKVKTETTTKSLEVEVSAAKSINGPLKLVTVWYARDTDTKQQVEASQEEGEVELDAAKTAKFIGKPYGFTSTAAHSTKGADGKPEKVRAYGQTFAGWVVRAYEGTILVGEAASSPTLLKQQK